MSICGGGLSADENWMSAETCWVDDDEGGQQEAGDQCAKH